MALDISGGLIRQAACGKVYGTKIWRPMTLTTSPRWTFITNYGLVLSYLYHHPRSTTREIANFIGVTERTTHKIISDLEAAGYIERRKSGRRNVYRVDPELPLRHHTKQDILVSDLLEALTAKTGGRSISPDRQSVPA